MDERAFFDGIAQSAQARRQHDKARLDEFNAETRLAASDPVNQGRKYKH